MSSIAPNFSTICAVSALFAAIISAWPPWVRVAIVTASAKAASRAARKAVAKFPFTVRVRMAPTISSSTTIGPMVQKKTKLKSLKA